MDDAQVMRGDEEFEQFPFRACPFERRKLLRRLLEGGEDCRILEALLVVPYGVAYELQAIAIDGWSGAFFPLAIFERTISASVKR